MQTIKLNLIPGSVLPVVNVSQYDKGRQFALQVYDGATAYDLTGKDVQIRGTKPDGNGFAYDSTDGAISVSTNTVTVTTLQQMTACGGQTMAELRITSGSDILGTINFILMVEPSALSDDTPISDTDIPAIERDLEAALDEAEADALIAEGYAKGTQNGTPVESGDPYYQDNAKYYKEQAATDASSAGTNALKAEGFAVGEQGGTPVTSESSYYQNNAEYYAQRAAQSVASGTVVDFYTQNGHLYVQQTIGGVPQTPVDLGAVGGASNLSDLQDVALASLADQQGLVYDNTTQKWKNKAVLLKDGSVAADNLTIGSRVSGSDIGANSFAQGSNVKATAMQSSAQGYYVTASGWYSHAEGYSTTASNSAAHAEGYATSASNGCAHAEGESTSASGYDSHAEGKSTSASKDAAHAEGESTSAGGKYSHSEGYHTTANYECNHAQGHYNKDMESGSSILTSGNAMVIGNGWSNALSNAFRVTFAGAVYGLSAFNSSGADYAEFFEWKDGNEKAEDRVGLFVTLDGDKIVPANAGDYILGIISGQPSIIGNGDEDWLGRWQRDDFGRFIWGDVEIEDPEKEENTTINTILPNPDYDPSKPYVERKDRVEWDYVGMLGTLAVRDNGKCKVNGFCECGKNGIAVPADSGYRVIARVSKNVVKVIFK